MCGYGPNVLGYGDPDVAAAAQAQARKEDVVSIPSSIMVDFAELLVDTVASADWAFFATQKEPRRGFTANTLAQYFHSLYRGAGIDGASSHSGRRSFATALASRGVGVRVLMRAMGHRNISTTIGYIDASDDMLRKAVSLV
jgi:integrase/recombinase XerD